MDAVQRRGRWLGQQWLRVSGRKGEKAPGGPDGFKVDKKGNLYGAGSGGVWIISPEGKHLATIAVPERVGNVAWGDKDGKTLYITASTSIYRIRLNIPGIMPAHP